MQNKKRKNTNFINIFTPMNELWNMYNSICEWDKDNIQNNTPNFREVEVEIWNDKLYYYWFHFETFYRICNLNWFHRAWLVSFCAEYFNRMNTLGRWKSNLFFFLHIPWTLLPLLWFLSTTATPKQM